MYQIRLKDTILNYSLIRKNVKRIFIKVKSGSAVVTANNSYSLYQIEEFILKNQDVILKAYNKTPDPYACFNYQTNDKLPLFKKEKTLIVQKGNKNNVSVVEDKIILSVENLQDESLRKKGIDALYKANTIKAVESLIGNVYNKFYLAYGIAFPKIVYKKLTGAWGNCRKERKEIHFSIYLSKLSLREIEYVIVHEFAHLIENNHSPKFYYVVQKIMPDYKIYAKSIKTQQLKFN